MIVTKEFYIIERYDTREDHITIDDLLNKVKTIKKEGYISYQNKKYVIVDVLIKEENENVYKIFYYVE